ncbi:type I-C CRISPR-associated protein Cas8c/Csd1, partial [Streptomyces sp. JAC128]|uniref:type I-C CRISPR-associated protein Cas8c/Csd1 n=1 Tax=Streptomyces sp. JAC128 TaxID=3418412 RepID=UPI003D816D2C
LTNLRIDANAQLKRLRRDEKGAAASLERRLSELFALFSDDMPRHLTPLQQGRFVMGYEHERAATWDRIRRAKEKGEDSPEE